MIDIDNTKLNMKIAKQALAMVESADEKLEALINSSSKEEMIGYQKGYIRALQEVIDEHEIDMECATHMETICLKCEKTFKLVPNNVKGHYRYPEHEDCVDIHNGDTSAIITCPHCKTEKVYKNANGKN